MKSLRDKRGFDHRQLGSMVKKTPPLRLFYTLLSTSKRIPLDQNTLRRMHSSVHAF